MGKGLEPKGIAIREKDQGHRTDKKEYHELTYVACEAHTKTGAQDLSQSPDPRPSDEEKHRLVFLSYGIPYVGVVIVEGRNICFLAGIVICDGEG